MKQATEWVGQATLVGAITLIAGLVGLAPIGAQDEPCLDCHDVASDPDLAAESYGIDGGLWRASIHADLGFGCGDCHEG